VSRDPGLSCCVSFVQGKDPEGTRRGVGSDVIWSERRGQSQKPEEIYELIEQLVPNGVVFSEVEMGA